MRKLVTIFSAIIVLLCQFPNIGYSQGQGNIWYFGIHAGLDFNTGVPVVLTNSAMSTNEGCAVISTSSGNLLFYTDGMYVYNANHLQMPNGFGLFGHPSSTNSGVIVPKLGNPNLYYVFTNDYVWGSNGLCYSIVDMTLNGGLGDVTIKNVSLLPTSSEKLTAVKHANNNDIWVVVHKVNSNQFYAYLVTSLGINAPVISGVGSTISNGTQGQLKASPCGDKLAYATYQQDYAEVLDFNNSTGVVSNPHTFYFSDATYGIEFSPNGNLVYIGVSYNNNKIYQVDLSTWTSTLIASPTLQIGCLQLGPDGKIYIAHFNYGPAPCDYLGIINNPNISGGGCNYVQNAIFLNLTGNNQSFYGLPNFMQSYFSGHIDLGPDTTICSGMSYILDAGAGYSSYLWQDGSTNQTFSATSSGTYWVSISGSCGSTVDTIHLTFGPVYSNLLRPDTSICEGNSIVLNPGAGYSSYLWQDGSTNQTYSVSASGLYSVTITDIGNCSLFDSVQVNVLPLPADISLGNDTFICQGSPLILDAGQGYSNYIWQDGSTNQTYSVTTSGTYSVTVSNQCGMGADSINVIVNPLPQVNLGADTSICQGSYVILDAGSGFTSYLWQDNSIQQTYTASLSGIYSVTVTDNNGCQGSDLFNLSVQQLPIVELGPDGDLCQSSEVMLNAGSGAGDQQYLWQDNSILPTYLLTSEGTYSVTVTNSCGSTTDSIYYAACPECILDLPNVFTPDGDGQNDILYILGSGFTNIHLMIYNRQGEKVFETTDPTQGWDGTYKGKKQTNEVYYYYLNADCLNGNTVKKKGDITLLN
jgi:gliding motility-associated-like protein